MSAPVKPPSSNRTSRHHRCLTNSEGRNALRKEIAEAAEMGMPALTMLHDVSNLQPVSFRNKSTSRYHLDLTMTLH